MADETSHLLGRNAGSHWLVSVSSLVVILLLGLWLAQALLNAEEQAEKLEVELTVRNMRTGLQWAKGEAMMQGRLSEIRRWEGSDPMRWLATAPANYLGSCPLHEFISPGVWCFDELQRELRYRPRHTQHLDVKIRSEIPLLRWKVVADASQAADGLVGLRVQNVTPYEWFAE